MRSMTIAQGNTHEQIAAMQKQLDELTSDFNTSEYDIWTEGGRSKQESEEFKNALIKYYKRKPSFFSHHIRCMVTNRTCRREQVIGSHIWKHSKRGRGMAKFGLTVADCLSPRNGLLMMKDIEMEFDIKGVCFLYDPLQQKLIFKVLDPNLRTKTITNTTLTFDDIDGNILHHPNTRLPFRRILNWHARCSFKHAKEQHWMESSEAVEDFFQLSETAFLPDTSW